MSYPREIPRDLFNEASLLKCFGRLALELERFAIPGVTLMEADGLDKIGFEVLQDAADGSIRLMTLTLWARGREIGLYRPLNSREPWPLWCSGPDGDEDFDDIEVFREDGSLSDDFLALLRRVGAAR